MRIPLLDKIESLAPAHDWTRNDAIVSQNILHVPFIVEQSDLIAILPRSFAMLFNKHCRISVFRPPQQLPPYTIDLVYPEFNEVDPAHAWFVKTILAAATDVRRQDTELSSPVLHAAPKKPRKARQVRRR